MDNVVHKGNATEAKSLSELSGIGQLALISSPLAVRTIVLLPVVLSSVVSRAERAEWRGLGKSIAY